MKVSVAFIVLCGVFCIAAAVPAAAGRGQGGLMYIQQHRPNRYYPSQQAMLVHYNHPKYASRRSSQEVAAFAAGDSIEGGTFIQEDEQPLQDGDSLSVAEAYPDSDDASALLAADVPIENEIQSDHTNEEYPLAQADPVFIPVAPQQDTHVAPPKKNKKKVTTPAPVTEEEEDDDDDIVPSANKKGQQWPHSFFPMNFGRTSGGAIAVANSFSNGKGGSATSHATAYGSPAAKKRL